MQLTIFLYHPSMFCNRQIYSKKCGKKNKFNLLKVSPDVSQPLKRASPRVFLTLNSMMSVFNYHDPFIRSLQSIRESSRKKLGKMVHTFFSVCSSTKKQLNQIDDCEIMGRDREIRLIALHSALKITSNLTYYRLFEVLTFFTHFF